MAQRKKIFVIGFSFSFLLFSSLLSTKDRWLGYIETETDKFLEKHDCDLQALPSNYTGTRPTDINAIEKNLNVIQEIIKDESGELQDLIEQTTNEVFL